MRSPDPIPPKTLGDLTASYDIAFYDWEENVVGDPDEPHASFDDLIVAARRAKPSSEDTDAPDDRANDAAPTVGVGARVPRGIVVLKAEPGPAPGAERYWVLEDDADLTGDDVRDPEQGFDQQTNEPVLLMKFTPEGEQSFARLTKRVAERGAEEGKPQRFAIVIDDRVVSLATIDYRQNPQGISGENGAQINGLGTVGEVKRLAEVLQAGALPARLTRIPG